MRLISFLCFPSSKLFSGQFIKFWCHSPIYIVTKERRKMHDEKSSTKVKVPSLRQDPGGGTFLWQTKTCSRKLPLLQVLIVHQIINNCFISAESFFRWKAEEGVGAGIDDWWQHGSWKSYLWISISHLLFGVPVFRFHVFSFECSLSSSRLDLYIVDDIVGFPAIVLFLYQT